MGLSKADNSISDIIGSSYSDLKVNAKKFKEEYGKYLTELSDVTSLNISHSSNKKNTEFMITFNEPVGNPRNVIESTTMDFFDNSLSSVLFDMLISIHTTSQDKLGRDVVIVRLNCE